MQPGGVLLNPKESSRTIKTFAVLTVSSRGEKIKSQFRRRDTCVYTEEIPVGVDIQNTDEDMASGHTCLMVLAVEE